MSGLLYQLRDDFPDQLRLTRGNVQGNMGTVVAYGVRGTPSLLVFHQKRLLRKWSGRINVDEVYDLLESLAPADAH